MKFIKYIILFLVAASVSSCLEMGLDELPAFSDSEIINVKFEHRWSVKEGTSDKLRVRVLTTDYTVNKEASKVTCKITLPAAGGEFTEEIRSSINLNKLTAYMTISTAATISPLDGAPILGAPGDWSKPNKYLVTAADGSKQEWTVEVTEFIR